jgi:hypothetical protein
MERKTPQRDCGPGLYEAFTPMKQRRSGCRLISSWTWSAIDSRNEANDPNIFDESDLGEGVQELQNGAFPLCDFRTLSIYANALQSSPLAQLFPRDFAAALRTRSGRFPTVILGQGRLLRAFGLLSPHRAPQSQSPTQLVWLMRRRRRRAAGITWARVACSYLARS